MSIATSAGVVKLAANIDTVAKLNMWGAEPEQSLPVGLHDTARKNPGYD